MKEFVPSGAVSSPYESVIAEASQNERVKLIVEWMLRRDLKNCEKIGIFYDYMAQILAEEYDLYDESIRSQVYERCEVGILESQLAL